MLCSLKEKSDTGRGNNSRLILKQNMENKGVSILISTYNGALRLEKTLTALASLDISNIPFVEVLLIDNASTDNTLEMAQEIWNNLGAPFSFTSLSESTPGKLYAQEKGLKHVKGEFIIICDDDNSLFPDYLQIGYNYFQRNPKIGVLGGRGVGVSTIELPEWFEKFGYYYGCAPQAATTGNVSSVRNVVYGAGMWFRYAAYVKAKELGYQFILLGRTGKKLTVGEDSEFCWVIIYQNYEVWYIDEMRFHHHITENRLSEKYLKELLEGMTGNGLNGQIHYRIWSGNIRHKVRFFWWKELLYTLLYIIKIPFSKQIKNKWDDFKRSKNNIAVLHYEKSNYDKKINNILEYKIKCDKIFY